MTPKASASSAANLATTFSCIFRLFRQAAFAACKKARRSSSTSPKDPKASRRKTSGLSNRGHKGTAQHENLRSGSSFFEVRENSAQDSRQAQTFERGASASATHVRDDNQFEDGDACELNRIILDLADRLRRAEVPLLANNFPKRVAAVARPAQDELLGPRRFFFFKNKRYLFQPLRLVKYEPNRLWPRFCGAPALCFS